MAINSTVGLWAGMMASFMALAVSIPTRTMAAAWLPPNAEVITREELQDGLYGYSLFDVLAALGRRAGVTIKSSSDVGAEDWLLVRGLPRDSARNVLVLIDGMPLNDAASEANEFEHLPPVEMIERIIVYKPPLPARFGGYHSAIEVLTRRNIGEGGAEVVAAYGSKATAMGSFSGQGQSGRFAWLGTLDYLRTDNLSGERRTPPKADQVYGDRSYRRTKPAAKLIYRGERAGFSLYGQYVDSTKYFSDTIFRGEKEFRDRNVAAFNLSGWIKPSADSNITWNLFRSDEGYRLNLQMHPSVQDQDRYRQGGRFAWAWTPSPRQQWIFGGEFTESHARERLGTPLVVTRLRTNGLFAEYTAQPTDRITLDVAVRRDDMSRASARWNYSAATSFLPSANTELYALRSRATRWPALSEIGSWDPATAIVGERLESAEVGIRRRLAGNRGTLKLSAFDLELKDEAKFVMDFASVPPFFGYRPQGDRVRSRGLELALDFSLSKHWSGFANYTYNRVKRDPDGDTVDFSGPRNLANLGLRYTGERLTVDLAGRYGGKAGGVQSMGAAPATLDDWFVVEAGARYRAGDGIELFLRGSNLFDERYETFDGRPMFGRVVIGGASVKW